MPPKRQAKKGLAPKPVVKKPEPEENVDDALDRFPLELKWCIQQIEITLERQKGPAKQEDLRRSLKTLTSTKATLIKKRQVMSSLFGDYRKKMAEEEKKYKIEQPKVKRKSFIPNKSLFLKKSHQNHFHHTDENKTQSSSEICAVVDSNSDTEHVRSDINASSVISNDENSEDNCIKNSSKDKLNNDNMVLNNFKYKPSGNSFRFNFSVST